MPGKKIFINNTGKDLEITLYVRQGANPINQATNQNVDFSLKNGEQKWIVYGDYYNVYLNGIKLIASYEGKIVSNSEIVIVRGSSLDNQLNTNNAVEFRFDGRFYIVTSNKSAKVSNVQKNYQTEHFVPINLNLGKDSANLYPKALPTKVNVQSSVDNIVFSNTDLVVYPNILLMVTLCSYLLRLLK